MCGVKLQTGQEPLGNNPYIEVDQYYITNAHAHHLGILLNAVSESVDLKWD